MVEDVKQESGVMERTGQEAGSKKSKQTDSPLEFPKGTSPLTF